MPHSRPDQSPNTHQRNADKVAKIPIKVEPTTAPLRKPAWIRMKQPGGAKVRALQNKLRQSKLNTVCEEAACPNLGECFTHGTATFMILGDICTRRCPFCDVAHGKPQPVDDNEAEELAKTVVDMNLNYVVITSVDRDDLRDGGAAHFAHCIASVREASPHTQIEILTPDFRGRVDTALEILNNSPPDVFNHNLETVPRLYKAARPGSDYQVSLNLLKQFKTNNPSVPTKSGLMVGLGETDEEILDVCRDLHAHDVEMLTIGQYLQPSLHHIRLERYVEPNIFEMYKTEALMMGFTHVASAPMVRSSYHADLQAKGKL